MISVARSPMISVAEIIGLLATEIMNSCIFLQKTTAVAVPEVPLALPEVPRGASVRKSKKSWVLGPDLLDFLGFLVASPWDGTIGAGQPKAQENANLSAARSPANRPTSTSSPLQSH